MKIKSKTQMMANNSKHILNNEIVLIRQLRFV